MAAIGQTAVGQTRAAPAMLRTPLFIVGVVLALLAFLLMFAFGIVFVNRSQTASTVTVVVAAADISPRQPLTADLLTTAAIPSTAVPPSALRKLSDATGLFAVVEIYKGEAITPNLVEANPDELAPGTTSSYLPIPTGYVAVTVPTGEQQGVAGYIAQGDYIDIIATVNTALMSQSNPRQVVRTVFNDVHVIRVGPPSSAPKQGQAQGVSSSLTLVMSLCDAQYLDWLVANANLKYVLLAPHEYLKQDPSPDSTCPSTSAPGVVGPSQVDSRWGFTKA